MTAIQIAGYLLNAMSTALFLGNSHLAALKLGFDSLDKAAVPRCRFFAARGADLAYTELVDGQIVERKLDTFGNDEQEMLFADMSPQLSQGYRERGEATKSVAEQFRMTGGSETIDLSDIEAIFYVLGVSPYDFRRLRKRGIDLAKAASSETVEMALGSKFVLRDLVKEIRAWRPGIKHCFVGIPLAATESDEEHAILTDEVFDARWRVAEIVGEHRTFDHVFMPPEHVLTPSLLATRPEYIHAGRRETQEYLSSERGRHIEDRAHLNRLYGTEVMREFVLPIIAPDHPEARKIARTKPIRRKQMPNTDQMPDRDIVNESKVLNRKLLEAKKQLEVAKDELKRLSDEYKELAALRGTVKPKKAAGATPRTRSSR